MAEPSNESLVIERSLLELYEPNAHATPMPGRAETHHHQGQFSFCAAVPDVASATSDAIPPALAMATWFSALDARFHSAPATFSFCAAVPDVASATSGAMPPLY